MPNSADFYEALTISDSFDDLTRSDAYEPLPKDWLIGTADIVGSTKQIEAGNYKTVNTVGAAVISAQINGADGMGFPFVFGGDGGAFAFHPDQEASARKALAEVRRWSKDEFGLELRAAIIPVSDIRKAKFDVTVARYQASKGADYAMFSGGGVSWAEKQMKSGKYAIAPAPVGSQPDLTGLSCRWTPMQSKNGTILSVVILPVPQAKEAEIAKVMHAVVEVAEGIERGGHPIPEEGPGYTWPPKGIDLEARASHGSMPLWQRKLQLLKETFIALLFFRTGISAGGFDPNHYVQTVAKNADFRKFEDGLKMTLDCDAKSQQQLEKILSDASDKNIVTYGLFEQDDAIMTCIVPSVTRDDHIHFVDGAAGGYTKAASKIKAQQA